GIRAFHVTGVQTCALPILIRYGDAAYADRQLAAIQATTAADVQRVARQILDDQRRVVVRYLPEQPGATGDVIATSPNIQAATLRSEERRVGTESRSGGVAR